MLKQIESTVFASSLKHEAAGLPLLQFPPAATSQNVHTLFSDGDNELESVYTTDRNYLGRCRPFVELAAASRFRNRPHSG